MATTTNYGWTTPDDTALVKDGAAAIRTLGSSVDTTTKNLNPSTTLGDIEYRSSTANTNTRLGIGSTGQVLTVAGGVPSWAAASSGALILIKKQTIGSAVASVTVTDAFSATYDNYLITVSDGSASVASNTVLTLGATTANYYMTGTFFSPTASTVTGFNINNGSGWTATYNTSSNISGHINLQSPFLSKRTTFSSILIGADSANNFANYMGFLANTTSYTAFTLTTSTGTLTGGEIRVYGYQNS